MPSSYLAQVSPDLIDPGSGGGSGCDPSQAGINLGNCVNLNETQKVGDIYQQPADLVNLVVQNIFIVAGLIIFAMILFAGYSYIIEGEKGKEKAKTIAETALLGLLVMFAAYWVVRLLGIVVGQDLLF